MVNQPPPQATMGLLNYITAHSLDEDYAHVHQLRELRGEEPRKPGRAAWVVFAAFGLLVGTAGVQTARTAGVAESSHESLVNQVNAGDKALEEARRRLTKVRAEALVAERANREANQDRAAEQLRVRRMGVVTGAVAVRGEGVRATVNDAPDAVEDENFVLDRDLRDIANGLWQAGAEAISINGQRLTTTSAIRFAGDSILVNNKDVHPPYVVLAVGNRDELPARFVESTTGTFFLNNKARYGLRFEMVPLESVTIPAVDPTRLELQSAQNKADQVEGDS